MECLYSTTILSPSFISSNFIPFFYKSCIDFCLGKDFLQSSAGIGLWLLEGSECDLSLQNSNRKEERGRVGENAEA